MVHAPQSSEIVPADPGNPGTVDPRTLRHAPGYPIRWEVAAFTKPIGVFRAQENRLPKNLMELVEKKYVGALPAPPPDGTLDYNPTSGELRLLRTTTP
jgi:hypothetical protein